jgi:hypothetical protein
MLILLSLISVLLTFEFSSTTHTLILLLKHDSNTVNVGCNICTELINTSLLRQASASKFEYPSSIPLLITALQQTFFATCEPTYFSHKKNFY